MREFDSNPRSNRRRVDAGHATQELLHLAREPDTPLRALASAIRGFPELEQTIRQRANATQKGLPKTIHSLEHALAFLGLTVVRQIIGDRFPPERVLNTDRLAEPQTAPAAFRRSA